MILRDPRGKLGRRQSFVEGEQRAAEQSCLLSRDDRDRLGIGEARRRLARGRPARDAARAASREARSARRVVADAVCAFAIAAVHDAGDGRIAGKKRRQR